MRPEQPVSRDQPPGRVLMLAHPHWHPAWLPTRMRAQLRVPLGQGVHQPEMRRPLSRIVRHQHSLSRPEPQSAVHLRRRLRRQSVHALHAATAAAASGRSANTTRSVLTVAMRSERAVSQRQRCTVVLVSGHVPGNTAQLQARVHHSPGLCQQSGMHQPTVRRSVSGLMRPERPLRCPQSHSGLLLLRELRR